MFREYTRGQLISRAKTLAKEQKSTETTSEHVLEVSLDMIQHKQGELTKWYWLYMDTLRELQNLQKQLLQG